MFLEAIQKCIIVSVRIGFPCFGKIFCRDAYRLWIQLVQQSVFHRIVESILIQDDLIRAPLGSVSLCSLQQVFRIVDILIIFAGAIRLIKDNPSNWWNRDSRDTAIAAERIQYSSVALRFFPEFGSILSPSDRFEKILELSRILYTEVIAE